MPNVKHFKLIVLFCEVSRHENPENVFQYLCKIIFKGKSQHFYKDFEVRKDYYIIR